MKVKHLTLATAGSLLAAGAAQAAFTGVQIYNMDALFDAHPNGNVATAWANTAGAYDVYRIYAEFDAAANVIATFGATGTPMYMNNLTSGVFHNYTETTAYGSLVFDTAPAATQFGDANKAAEAFDTFATIGLFVNAGGADQTTLTPLFDTGVGHFETDWSSDNVTGGTGGWFSFNPTAAQTAATTNSQGLPADGVFRVLLFQVTVNAGDKVEGQFGVSTSTQGNFYGANTFFTTSPTPGALALLGLAGFAGTRRRRK